MRKNHALDEQTKCVYGQNLNYHKSVAVHIAHITRLSTLFTNCTVKNIKTSIHYKSQGFSGYTH